MLTSFPNKHTDLILFGLVRCVLHSIWHTKNHIHVQQWLDGESLGQEKNSLFPVTVWKK